MDTTRVSHVNSMLIVIAAVIAWFIPFGLFLFVYAVLGPLHYLTEINWLRDKDFFTRARHEPMLLVLCGIFLSVLFVAPIPDDVRAKLLIGIFLAALVMIFTLPTRAKVAAYVLIPVVLFLAPPLPAGFVLFAFLLPTLTHVYVFTGAFMLHGSLKERSRSGYVTFFLFLAVPLLFAASALYAQSSTVSASVQNIYHSFEGINRSLLSLIGAANASAAATIYSSVIGIIVMRFIAFAYTYHYLNWFSKTKVVRWNTMPRSTLRIIVVLWLAAVLTYAIDYRLGIFVLFFLSLLHVLLEFPLNHKTFFAIGTILRQQIGASLARAREIVP